MAGVDFDDYAADYRGIINRGAAITGETFEYFIDLRVRLLREKLAAMGAAPPRDVLDFGCGIGATEACLRKHFPAANLVGFDESAESVREAEKLGIERARFVSTRERALPLEPGAFDLVYSNGTFHHIEPARRDDVMRQLHGVLRPGGHAFVFENNPYNPVMVRAMRRNPFDRDAQMLRPRELAARLERAGFTVRGVEYYVFYPGPLKFLRPTERLLRRVPLGAQYFAWAVRA